MISFSAISVFLFSLYGLISSHWELPKSLTLTVSTLGVILSIVPLIISIWVFFNESFSKLKLLKYHFLSFVLSDYFPYWNDIKRFKGESIFCNQFINNRETRYDTKFATFEVNKESIRSNEWKPDNYDLIKTRVSVFNNERDSVNSPSYGYLEIDGPNFDFNYVMGFNCEEICGSIFRVERTNNFVVEVHVQTGEVNASFKFHWDEVRDKETISLEVSFMGVLTSASYTFVEKSLSKSMCQEVLKVISAIVENPSRGVCNFKKERHGGGLERLHTLSIQECVQKIKSGRKLYEVRTEGKQRVVYHGLDDGSNYSVPVNLIYGKYSGVVKCILNCIPCSGGVRERVLSGLKKYDLKGSASNLKNWQSKRFLVNMAFIHKLLGLKVNTKIDKKVPVSKWLAEEIGSINSGKELEINLFIGDGGVNKSGNLFNHLGSGIVKNGTLTKVVEIIESQDSFSRIHSKISDFKKHFILKSYLIAFAPIVGALKKNPSMLTMDENCDIANAMIKLESLEKSFSKNLKKAKKAEGNASDVAGGKECKSLCIDEMVDEFHEFLLKGSNKGPDHEENAPKMIKRFILPKGSKSPWKLKYDEVKVGSEKFIELNESIKYKKLYRSYIDAVKSGTKRSGIKSLYGIEEKGKNGKKRKFRKLSQEEKNEYLRSLGYGNGGEKGGGLSIRISDEEKEKNSLIAAEHFRRESRRLILNGIRGKVENAVNVVKSSLNNSGWKEVSKTRGASKRGVNVLSSVKKEIIPLIDSVSIESKNMYSTLLNEGQEDGSFKEVIEEISTREIENSRRYRISLGKTKYLDFDKVEKKKSPKLINNSLAYFNYLNPVEGGRKLREMVLEGKEPVKNEFKRREVKLNFNTQTLEKRIREELDNLRPLKSMIEEIETLVDNAEERAKRHMDPEEEIVEPVHTYISRKTGRSLSVQRIIDEESRKEERRQKEIKRAENDLRKLAGPFPLR